MNGTAFSVVGVTPFDYLATAPSVPDLWAPAIAKIALRTSTRQDFQDRRVFAGSTVGRLKEGVSLSDAQAELNVLAAQLRTLYPDARCRTPHGFDILPFLKEGDSYCSQTHRCT